MTLRGSPEGQTIVELNIHQLEADTSVGPGPRDTGDTGAGAADRGVRPTGSNALGQRSGVLLASHLGLGRRGQDRASAHTARAAHAEQARRELPRPAAR
jgi:hypothetical protein